MANAKLNSILQAKGTRRNKLQCSVCGRVFYSEEMFTNHMTVNHPSLNKSP